MKFNLGKIILFNLLVVALSNCDLSPGSYPFAERYRIATSEDKLIEALKAFKINNPNYTVPEGVSLQDGRRNNQDHWYHFYLLDPETNQIIKTWIRGSGNETTFALVAVYHPNTAVEWKFINKDLDKENNQRIKKRFENDILNPIMEALQ